MKRLTSGHQTTSDLRQEGYRAIPLGKDINGLTEQEIEAHLATLRINPASVRLFTDMLGKKYIIRKTASSVRNVLDNKE